MQLTKLKKIQLTAELMHEQLDMKPGIEIAEISRDHTDGSIEITIWSDSFDEMPEGSETMDYHIGGVFNN